MRPHRTSASGLLLALLALTMQLALGAAAPRLTITSALAVASTICHADATPGETPQAPHDPADCPICPLCLTVFGPAFTLTARTTDPAPRVVIVTRAAVPPPATAPPAVVTLAARPRGPPVILA